MHPWLTGAAAVVLLTEVGCATTGYRNPSIEAGRILFQSALNPDLNFSGDLRPSSDDELVLTVAASNRDDYAPAYSLAIAYRCLPTDADRTWQCRYFARMLRVGPPGEEQIDLSFALVARVHRARSAGEMKPLLDDADLQWLEADLAACDGAIHAMDSIRVADWRPDIHYALQPVEEREVILHPAMIRVRMTGSSITSRYQGWVLADGVPAAVRRLLDTLESCWTPSSSRRPWRR